MGQGEKTSKDMLSDIVWPHPELQQGYGVKPTPQRSKRAYTPILDASIVLQARQLPSAPESFSSVKR